MAWKYDEDNKKEIFTRREIHKDLKSAEKRSLLSWTVGFVFGFLVTLMLWCLALIQDSVNLGSIIIAIASSVLFLMLAGILIYLTILYFDPIKYEIVSDTYQYMDENAVGGVASAAVSPLESLTNLRLGGQDTVLVFKTYGEYKLLCHYDSYYYKWSKLNKSRGFEMQQCISKGDEYYLIIINNKIAYIYSKRVFEFKDTQ